MRVILLPVADRPECKMALDAAFVLAGKLQGSLIGCHLRPHRSEGKRDSFFESYLGFRRSTAIAARLTVKEIDLRRRAAERLFVQRAEQHEFKLVKRPRLGAEHVAQWVEMIGSLDRLFSIVGPTTDASIVSRPMENAKGPGADFMLAALLETGKPVFVLPQSPISSLGKRITIAWNQSVQAARAVTAALPLLQQAEAVNIVVAGPESRTGPKATALVNYLRFWGVKAERIKTRGQDPGDEILRSYRSAGSDLIVMGAYSRGRFRERIFGGVTEDLLFRSGEPVFCLHS